VGAAEWQTESMHDDEEEVFVLIRNNKPSQSLHEASTQRRKRRISTTDLIFNIRCYEKRKTRHCAAPARKSPAVRLPYTLDSKLGVGVFLSPADAGRADAGRGKSGLSRRRRILQRNL
jgi:hypothetical protein